MVEQSGGVHGVENGVRGTAFRLRRYHGDGAWLTAAAGLAHQA